MTGPCFRLLWQNLEYATLDENMVFHLKDDAPEIAKESYKEYQRYHSEEAEEARRKFFEQIERDVDEGDDD